MTLEDALLLQLQAESENPELGMIANSVAGGGLGYTASAGGNVLNNTVDRLIKDPYMGSQGFSPRTPAGFRPAGLVRNLVASVLGGTGAAAITANTPSQTAEALAALKTGSVTPEQAKFIEDVYTRMVATQGGLA